MNFLELQTIVRTNVIDLPAAVTANVPIYINRAMVSLQNAHQFKVMEALSGPNVTVVGTRTLMAAPAAFKEARGDPYYVTNIGGVIPMRWAPGRAEAQSTFNIGTQDIGPPKLLVDAEHSNESEARNFEVFPLPDGFSDYAGGEYRVFVPYWRYLTPLSANGDTNWFTQNAEEYLEIMATAYAFYADWDENRGALWEARAKGRDGTPGMGGKMREAILRDKRARIGGTETLVPHWEGANAPRHRF